MTRISTFCVLSSTLAVIALSANGASAATVTVPVPRVIVHVPQPKVTVRTPQLKTLGNHGTGASPTEGQQKEFLNYQLSTAAVGQYQTGHTGGAPAGGGGGAGKVHIKVFKGGHQ
jgi:hypothetical protein